MVTQNWQTTAASFPEHPQVKLHSDFFSEIERVIVVMDLPHIIIDNSPGEIELENLQGLVNGIEGTFDVPVIYIVRHTENWRTYMNELDAYNTDVLKQKKGDALDIPDMKRCPLNLGEITEVGEVHFVAADPYAVEDANKPDTDFQAGQIGDCGDNSAKWTFHTDVYVVLLSYVTVVICHTHPPN